MRPDGAGTHKARVGSPGIYLSLRIRGSLISYSRISVLLHQFRVGVQSVIAISYIPHLGQGQQQQQNSNKQYRWQMKKRDSVKQRYKLSRRALSHAATGKRSTARKSQSLLC